MLEFYATVAAIVVPSEADRIGGINLFDAKELDRLGLVNTCDSDRLDFFDDQFLDASTVKHLLTLVVTRYRKSQQVPGFVRVYPETFVGFFSVTLTFGN
jgi:hypothetical protein